MINYVFILLCLLPSAINALNQNEAIKARDEALQTLRGFNPSSVLKDYTDKPSQTSLQSQEGTNTLSAQGLNALKDNQTANEVYTQAGIRPKVRPNPESWTMRYAEALLDNPEKILEGDCYKVPGECVSQSTTKQCIESVKYSQSSCQEILEVQVQTKIQDIFRILSFPNSQSSASFDLQSCSSNEPHCTGADTVALAPACEQLGVSVWAGKKSIPVLKQPTCNDSKVIISFHGYFAFLNIKVTQYVGIDHWKNSDCKELKAKISQSQCFIEESARCLDPNQPKIINGLEIKRPCWGKADIYQCATLDKSTCDSLMSLGCSQSASECIEVKDNHCLKYSQSFQCVEENCKPEATICPGKMACIDDSCDISKSEVSNDIAEGVSRLGVLTGSADAVAANQIRSDSPAIFTGAAYECKTYPLGFRDCCTDSGWGDWIKNCPRELQDLQKAKLDNRVVYLGHYHNHKFGAEHHSYCVFPTKLAAIFQIQGRSQLGIDYGSAEVANCRGLTPKELERINFALLNLSPIEQELMARMKLPNDGQINKNNQDHIEHLKEKGRAYD